MSFKEHILGLLRSKWFLTSAGSMVVTGNYVMYTDRKRVPNMEKSYSRGNILPPLAENQYEVKYYARPQLEARLRAILAPTFTNQYYLVRGEVGCGKSRTIIELVRSMMLEDGSREAGAPIYVNATQGRCFAESLATAIHYNFDEHISFQYFLDIVSGIHSVPKKDDHHRLTRVLDAMEKSAFLYMQKTGRPVVLIIDGLSSLTLHAPGALEKLEVKAKLWADSNIVKMIFVSNDEKTELILQEHQSSWLRAASPIFIGDLTQREALEFLTDPKIMEHDSCITRPAMTEQQAEDIHKFVGGRIHHLLSFKRGWHEGTPVQRTMDELLQKEHEKFMDVSKSTSSLKAIKLIKEYSDKGQYGIPLSKLIDSTSSEVVARLLKCNVMRIERKGSGMVATFESKLAENVVKQLCAGS